MNLSPPKENYYIPYNISNFYGASFLMSKIAKISHTNLMWRYWQHGWSCKHRQYDPELIATEPLDQKWKIYVARKDEVDILAKFGYKSKAISLPFAYAFKYFDNFDRKENSLLFMPQHGNHDIGVNLGSKSKKFIEELADSEFNKNKRLFVSLHGDDLSSSRKFYEKLGFRVVLGAAINDLNSLLRMKYFFQTFEYVATNSVGSHIPYASLCGAKISLLDDSETTSNYKNNPFFSKRVPPPNLIKYYPFLINSIENAREHKNWAKQQLGFENILTPQEIKKEFGWHLSGRLTKRTYFFLSKLKRNLLTKK